MSNKDYIEKDSFSKNPENETEDTNNITSNTTGESDTIIAPWEQNSDSHGLLEEEKKEESSWKKVNILLGVFFIFSFLTALFMILFTTVLPNVQNEIDNRQEEVNSQSIESIKKFLENNDSPERLDEEEIAQKTDKNSSKVDELSNNSFFIPSIDSTYSVRETHSSDGELILPDAPEIARYDGSSDFNEEGNTIVAGHVNYNNLSMAPIARIASTEPGDRVFVKDEDGTVLEYEIESLRTFEKDSLPEEIFSKEGGNTLSLITCSDESISSDPSAVYEYNLVVDAKLVEAE